MMDQQRIADDLLWPIWRGVDSAYKVRYARNIWQQFEDNIRSAAYTSRLAPFYDALCRRLNVRVRADEAERVNAIIASGEDRAVLKALRDETTYLVLLVRLKNEERKADYAAEQAAQGELF